MDLTFIDIFCACYWEYMIWYYYGGGKFFYDLEKKIKEYENLSKPKQEKKKIIYAIDFDDTICYVDYPTILKPIPYAFEVLKILMKNKNSIIILYTCRHDEELKSALDYLKMNGIEFDYVNENVKELIDKYGDCRKIYADVYIDDHNYMGNSSIEELWKNWYRYLNK